MKTIPFILLALLASACGDDHSDELGVDQEGCEHLAEGPATPVTASAIADSSAPAVADDHMRYDITLVDDGGGQNVGSVSFAAAEAGDYVLFLGQDVPVAVADSTNQPIDIEASASSSEACPEIRGRHVVELGVGTHFFTFGPTSESAVQLVIEPDGEHEEHEGE